MHDTVEPRRRTASDRVGILLTTAAVMAFAAVALYGMMSGFTPTLAYEAANLWVGLGCALLAGLCGVYLMIELAPRARLRAQLLLPVVCGFAGYYATIAGIPTIHAQWAGQRGSAEFLVTDASMPWGAKSCSFSVEGANPGYAQLRLCADKLEPRPRAGDRLRVDGNISDWGITTDLVTVLR